MCERSIYLVIRTGLVTELRFVWERSIYLVIRTGLVIDEMLRKKVKIIIIGRLWSVYQLIESRYMCDFLLESSDVGIPPILKFYFLQIEDP